MAKQDTRSAADDMQNLFNPENYQDMFRTMASYNERMAQLVINAAAKSSDVANDTAQQAFSNLREVTSVKGDPSEYAQAYSEFAQKQADLVMRTAQSLGEIAQNTGQETAEMASNAGQQMGDKAAAKADEAAGTAKSAAKKAS